ncbi:RkpR, polysaccharide export protein [Stappia sp. GBMRC 2046]|uniref:RkpR, polysaccharide export protein n=1 Tax=Stappia sediminis TaxID=2692190 RepID=A0A7X3LY50_9HYPH|nr:RkpR, polysaccharide export protein [Stappia sediminis]MXN67188.1 RkpR, polysaccharide export protein [Stappia sediminis]
MKKPCKFISQIWRRGPGFESMAINEPEASNVGKVSGLAENGNRRSSEIAGKANASRKLAVVAGNAVSARLRHAGLDPMQLVRARSAAEEGQVKIPLRHRWMVLGFVFGVLLPAIVVTVYMVFIAADQYHSRTAFAVRTIENAGATELLGLVVQGGGASTTSDSYIISDYLQSQAVVEDISKTLDLEAIFNRSNSDWYFAMGEDLPIEDKVEYWNTMVDVNYDATSGLITIETRAFAPEDATAIADALVEISERLVNRLADKAHRESIRFAKQEVARAEARLKIYRKELLQYREETQEISPLENARITVELIASLEQELTKNQAELKTLKQYLDPQSPQIRILERQILSLEEQISSERQRLGAGNGTSDVARRSISNRLASYEELEVEREFAQKAYTAALAGLENARAEADSKQIYLAVSLHPSLSEDAQYPYRLLSSLTVFLLLFGVWLVCVLTFYNFRDRR